MVETSGGEDNGGDKRWWQMYYSVSISSGLICNAKDKKEEVCLLK